MTEINFPGMAIAGLLTFSLKNNANKLLYDQTNKMDSYIEISFKLNAYWETFFAFALAINIGMPPESQIIQMLFYIE